MQTKITLNPKAVAAMARGRCKAHVIRHGFATLTADGFGTDRRFVMTGPSGSHSLLVLATPRSRLEAHWRGFVSDARNHPVSPA